MNLSRTVLGTAILACLTLSMGVFAQEQEPGDALRGPEVPDRTKRTIVHHTMTGTFQQVEGRPEAAAVEALELDETTRAAAAAIVEQRSVDVALLLVREIDRVKLISDAVVAQEGERSRALLVELWEHFEPGRPHAPLATSFAELLDETQTAELHRLIEEYWDAWIDWELRDAGEIQPDALAGVVEETRARLAFQLFQQEVGEGYEATLRRYRDAMEGIYNAVEPTEEQREAMREILIDHIRATQLTPTPEERRASMIRMYRVLDEERRERLYEYLLRQVVPDLQG